MSRLLGVNLVQITKPQHGNFLRVINAPAFIEFDAFIDDPTRCNFATIYTLQIIDSTQIFTASV